MQKQIFMQPPAGILQEEVFLRKYGFNQLTKDIYRPYIVAKLALATNRLDSVIFVKEKVLTLVVVVEIFGERNDEY